jgi:hypothetical protein
MKGKTVMVCNCESECKQYHSFYEMTMDKIAIPYEWIMYQNIFEKWEIYYCPNCRYLYRKAKRLNYIFDEIKKWLKGLIKNE